MYVCVCVWNVDEIEKASHSIQNVYTDLQRECCWGRVQHRTNYKFYWCNLSNWCSLLMLLLPKLFFFFFFFSPFRKVFHFSVVYQRMKRKRKRVMFFNIFLIFFFFRRFFFFFAFHSSLLSFLIIFEINIEKTKRHVMLIHCLTN